MNKLYLSVDLEKDPWTNQVPVEETLTLLTLLGEQKITFFVSGEVFEEASELVAQVAASGHEIGLHSFHHKIITNTDFLKNELTHSKNFIKIYKPQGFRAPFAKLPAGSLNILKEFGFKYDSSAFFPKIISGDISELAVSSWKLFPRTSHLTFPRGSFAALLNFELPYGSGLFTTLFPTIQRFLINHSLQPAVIFIHPWQLKRHFFNSDLNLIPYAPSALTATKYLCRHYKLAKMIELVNEN